MEPWRPELFLPLFGALAAGCAVGFEREYRARAAGFRTHALVALASALLMLAALHQVEWAGSTTPLETLRIDPVRMAHGILTGIGFLCGGVIFKEGPTVHGLTTAASLWITSALGVLFGVGLYGLAIGGTVATLVVLSLFRAVDHWIPGQDAADLVVRFPREVAPEEAELRTTLESMDLRILKLAQRLVRDGAVVEFAALARSNGTMNTALIGQALRDDSRVLEFALDPRGT